MRSRGTKHHGPRTSVGTENISLAEIETSHATGMMHVHDVGAAHSNKNRFCPSPPGVLLNGPLQPWISMPSSTVARKPFTNRAPKLSPYCSVEGLCHTDLLHLLLKPPPFNGLLALVGVPTLA